MFRSCPHFRLRSFLASSCPPPPMSVSTEPSSSLNLLIIHSSSSSLHAHHNHRAFFVVPGVVEQRSMKLRCDVCNNSDAAVFCSADEAALCGRCDARVHRANKLASRHQRSSLVLSTSEDCPPCDICRERRAFLFCQQDRAIVCTVCDLSIHSANEHAKKHDRFVLTGLKLSNCSRTHGKLADESLKAISEGGTVLDQSRSKAANSTEPVYLSNAGCGSLSEYLMETLPGWQVDEFLESSCSSSGNSKNVDEFLDPVDFGSNLSWGAPSNSLTISNKSC